MDERKEILMRIVVAIVSVIILAVWRWLILIFSLTSSERIVPFFFLLILFFVSSV